jgi:hypothetical protein
MLLESFIIEDDCLNERLLEIYINFLLASDTPYLVLGR